MNCLIMNRRKYKVVYNSFFFFKYKRCHTTGGDYNNINQIKYNPTQDINKPYTSINTSHKRQ